MYRHSHTVFLQKQGAWTFWKIWIFLDKDRLWSDTVAKNPDTAWLQLV